MRAVPSCVDWKSENSDFVQMINDDVAAECGTASPRPTPADVQKHVTQLLNEFRDAGFQARRGTDRLVNEVFMMDGRYSHGTT